jgi:hypothetical protein
MSQDLTQKWLEEIKNLTAQMLQFQRERDEAWNSSQKWRQLYNTEAEQRRIDARMYQQAILSLEAKIQTFSGINEESSINADKITTTQAEIAKIESLEELQSQLLDVITERDSLLQALKLEQENHSQTRKSLTTALGDAIDGLAQARLQAEKVQQSQTTEEEF